MKTPFLREVRCSLDEAVQHAELSSVERAFRCWLEQSPGSISDLTKDAVAAHGASRTYQTVAILGFACATDYDETSLGALEDGLAWLLSRPLRRSTGDLQEYVVDSLALYGLSLAVSAIRHIELRESVRIWIGDCLRAGAESYLSRSQKATFAGAANKALGLNAIPELEPNAITNFCLKHRLGQAIDRPISDKAFVEIQQLSTGSIEGLKAVEALYAFEAISKETTTIDVERPTLEQLKQVLDRVSSVMYRWPYGQGNNSTWEMNNEYDFQALLYAVLSPIFKDLKDEEWLASIGSKKPRADLAILSLRTVIEVKFRRKERMSEFIGQIAEDKSLYLRRDSPYEHMLVVMWDDAQATEEHEVLRQGVRDLDLAGAFIVSRPARMSRDQEKASKKTRHS